MFFEVKLCLNIYSSLPRRDPSLTMLMAIGSPPGRYC